MKRNYRIQNRIKLMCAAVMLTTLYGTQQSLGEVRDHASDHAPYSCPREKRQ